MVPSLDSLPPLDDDRRRRLDSYADRFGGIFTRTDQSRWFRLYLQGLLGDGNRKNVEAIAAQVRTDDPGTTNFAQALQHFVSHSPWDPGRVLARYRELLPDAAREGPGVWVVHDGVIPKKGRHSVGTQRQFARPIGRKVNCQVGVVVGRAGPFGYIPLAIRLYLPGYWLRENQDAVEKTVPAEFRAHVSKQDIASGLLDELIREGWSAGATAADNGYLTSETFREFLSSRSAGIVTAGSHSPGPVASEWGPADQLPAVATGHFDRLKRTLGLDHFEGRAWLGWHHHAVLVLAAYGFLVSEAGVLQ
ncbi:MAG: transposase [Gemmataceae bacterium]|nr:transposase [Gemmataceae bacterium]